MKKIFALLLIIVLFASVAGFLAFKSGLMNRQSASVAPAASSTVSPNTAVQSNTANQKENQKINMNHLVTLDTNFGKIKFETYDEDAPKTAKNFITLAQKGFYNNLTFHRVINGFMIQGGDPVGNGTGGPGYSFEDELNPATASYQQGYKKGVVAMANAGPNTNGSQFFIMLQDTPLPHNYTIFGKVISGQDVVDAIGKTPTGPGDRPIQPVTIKSAEVE